MNERKTVVHRLDMMLLLMLLLSPPGSWLVVPGSCCSDTTATVNRPPAAFRFIRSNHGATNGEDSAAASYQAIEAVALPVQVVHAAKEDAFSKMSRMNVLVKANSAKLWATKLEPGPAWERIIRLGYDARSKLAPSLSLSIFMPSSTYSITTTIRGRITLQKAVCTPCVAYKERERKRKKVGHERTHTKILMGVTEGKSETPSFTKSNIRKFRN